MRIVFNGLSSGLGNNGGSKTILTSAKIIRSLGHTCEVAAHVDNFKWFEHRPVINILPKDFDVVINIAAIDYNITKVCPIRSKYAWWRGHEQWSNTLEHLTSCYTDSTVTNLVNSNGLKGLLEGFGAASHVVYQGVDFDLWEDRCLRSQVKYTIGCLYGNKETKRWSDFVKLAELLGSENYTYIGFGLQKREDVFLTSYITDPTHDELVDLYSSCDFWLCPTVAEGLHNIGMEAALCGAKIICSDCKDNGMILDYANDDTSIIYPKNNMREAARLIENIDMTTAINYVRNMNFNLRTSIGTREHNMKRLLAVLGAWG